MLPISARNTDFVNPWAVALSVMLATFMEVLDTSVANVALPHIAGNLSSTVDESTWVLTSYLVSNAIVLPMAGWFSTLFGRKRFYMICVVLFTASSFLCGFAPTLGALILFRVLQGIGGGAMQPIAQAILVESFPREKQGMAMAVYGMGVVVAPIIGPTLGGWITDNYSWRWIFLINIPVGVLAFGLAWALVFDPPYLVRKGFRQGLHIDFAGLGFIAVGLGALEIFLDEGQREDWFGSQLIVVSCALAVLALALAVVWELRQPDPIVNLRLLQNRNFCVAVVFMFLLGFVLYGSTVLLPIFLQTLMGYTATRSGLVLSPGGVATVVLLPLVGIALKKIEARWLLIAGCGICAIGLFQMAGFNLQVDYGTSMRARMVQSAGLAFLFVPLNTLAFSSIPKRLTNSATGLINLARNIGGSTGIAAVTTVLARRAQFHQHQLVAHLTPLHPGYREMLDRTGQFLVLRGDSPADAAHRAHGLLYGMLLRDSTMKAFLDAFWLLAVIFLVMAPLMFLMRRAPAGQGH